MLLKQTDLTNFSHATFLLSESLLIMYLSLLLLVGSIACSTTRISQPNFEAVNFVREIEGRRLSGSVIKEMEVETTESCQFECVDEKKCFSYNVGTANFTKDNAKRIKCELSNSDRFAGFANFLEDKDFNYGGLQVITLTEKKIKSDVVQVTFKIIQLYNFYVRFALFLIPKRNNKMKLHKSNILSSKTDS